MAANEAFLSAQQAPATAAPAVPPVRPPAPLLLQKRTHSVPISGKPVDVHTLTVDELREILKDMQAKSNTVSPAVPMPAPVDKPKPIQKRQANCALSLPNNNRFSILSTHNATSVDEFDEAVRVVQPVKDSPVERKYRPRWERHLPAMLVIAALEEREDTSTRSLKLKVSIESTDTGKVKSLDALVDSGATGCQGDCNSGSPSTERCGRLRNTSRRS
jgi:hypothetical protein